MNTGVWDEPVTFATTTLGQYRTITSATEAAHVLMGQSPINDGKELRRARRACLDVLQGTREPTASREAFLRAAEEAGVFIRK